MDQRKKTVNSVNRIFAECPMEYTRQTLRHSAIILFPIVQHGYMTWLTCFSELKSYGIPGEIIIVASAGRCYKNSTEYQINLR